MGFFATLGGIGAAIGSAASGINAVKGLFGGGGGKKAQQRAMELAKYQSELSFNDQKAWNEYLRSTGLTPQEIAGVSGFSQTSHGMASSQLGSDAARDNSKRQAGQQAAGNSMQFQQAMMQQQTALAVAETQAQASRDVAEIQTGKNETNRIKEIMAVTQQRQVSYQEKIATAELALKEIQTITQQS